MLQYINQSWITLTLNVIQAIITRVTKKQDFRISKNEPQINENDLANVNFSLWSNIAFQISLTMFAEESQYVYMLNELLWRKLICINP